MVSWAIFLRVSRNSPGKRSTFVCLTFSPCSLHACFIIDSRIRSASFLSASWEHSSPMNCQDWPRRARLFGRLWDSLDVTGSRIRSTGFRAVELRGHVFFSPDWWGRLKCRSYWWNRYQELILESVQSIPCNLSYWLSWYSSQARDGSRFNLCAIEIF